MLYLRGGTARIDRSNAGQTALTAELARLVPGDLVRHGATLLGMERTDWVDHFGKPKIARTVLTVADIDALEVEYGISLLPDGVGLARVASAPAPRFAPALP